jgi:hypothetical protein
LKQDFYIIEEVMSTDSKHDFKNDENNLPEVSIERVNSLTISEKSQSNSRLSTPKPTNEVINQRPPSPVTRHRVAKQQTPVLIHRQRNRSSSPRKTFSYLSPDSLNLRQWKQQTRQIAKQEEDDRIYHENRQKLERLAKIAKEPSSYPSVHLEQERLRNRHAYDYHRKVLKNYIPILQSNVFIVDRLANIKGVYDRKKMHADFLLHQSIIERDANHRQKMRDTATERPFILPKINLKS